jgi:periplasmic protein TonB
MHWEWIVPVIALALWIISSLVKSAEEKPKQAKPGEPLPDAVPPRPQSEVDRFLEEINRMRRRQEEEQRQQEPTRRSEPLPPIPPPPPPVVVQVEPKASEPTTAPNFEKPAVVVEKPKTRIVKTRRTEPRPTPPRQPAVIVEATLPHLAPSVQAPTPSPAIAQIYAMLRSPQSIQAAILLQEVMGPPRCRRRR